MQSTIYLDNNATTRIDSRVADAIRAVHDLQLVNPSSQHRNGRESRAVLESAREKLLQLLDCRTSGMQSDQLLFTSGGTESNNLAIFGLEPNRPKSESHPKAPSNDIPSSKNDPSVVVIADTENCPLRSSLIVSSIEHPSVIGATDELAKRKVIRHFIPADSSGTIDLNQLENRLSNAAPASVRMVSIMLANNETGVIQPINDAAAICKKFNVLLHTDAVQVLGKAPLSFRELDVDAMTITAHKLHGPAGIGALVIKSGVSISPQLFGGFQQLGMRPGTESIALAVGFAKAAELAVQELATRIDSMEACRVFLESSLLSRFRQWKFDNQKEQISDPYIVGQTSMRLPHTSCIAFPGLDRQTLQLALDRVGIAVSTGSACASGSSQPSHVLQAMGLDPRIVQSAIRISLDYKTTKEQITEAISRIVEVVGKLYRLANL